MDVEAGRATVSELAVNTRFRLSDGTGFTYTDGGATSALAGWSDKAAYDPADADAHLYELGGVYGVDAEAPVTLYAVWQTTATYHLDDASGNWGGEWDSSVYRYDSENDTYTKTVYLNGMETEPEYLPASGSGKLFRYWAETVGDDELRSGSAL